MTVDTTNLNRAERRALKHRKAKKGKTMRFATLLLQAKGLPTVADNPERVELQKLRLFSCIAALKDGSFEYEHITMLYEFVSVAMSVADTRIGAPLKEGAEALAKVVQGICERHVATGKYGANGDELRALSTWVEPVAEALAEIPEIAMTGYISQHKLTDAAVRAEIMQRRKESGE